MKLEHQASATAEHARGLDANLVERDARIRAERERLLGMDTERARCELANAQESLQAASRARTVSLYSAPTFPTENEKQWELTVAAMAELHHPRLVLR